MCVPNESNAADAFLKSFMDDHYCTVVFKPLYPETPLYSETIVEPEAHATLTEELINRTREKTIRLFYHRKRKDSVVQDTT